MLRSVLPLLFAFLLTTTALPERPAFAEEKLLLSTPEEGAVWSAGSQHYVTWSPTDAGPMLLVLSIDGVQTSQEIAQINNEDGWYLWTVPDTLSKNCQLLLIGTKTGAVCFASALFEIAPSQAVPEYEWTKVTMTAEFAPRDGAGALVYKDKMWFLGGWNPGDKTHFPRICNNEVWSSADGKSWTLEKPNTFLDATFDSESDWEGRHTAGYTVFKDKMWIVGGDVNQGHYHFDVWNTDNGKKWTLVNKGKPVPWGPRALHYTLTFKDHLWVMGGQIIPQFAPGEDIVHRDIWKSADGINWEQVQPKEPYWSPRGMIGGNTVFKDRIWILGGGTYDTPKYPERNYYNDVWSSADGVEWTQHVEHAPWAGRQYHDVAVYDDRLWVLEGYAKGNRNDVWYSADGVNWYEVPNTPWATRHAASVFVHDGALWMVAGNNMQPDVWKLQRKAAAQ